LEPDKQKIKKKKKKPWDTSLSINGTSTINQQAIASAFNTHFIILPSRITRKITASSCLTASTANNQNNTIHSLNNVPQTPYPSIRYNRTTTKEIENIIKSLKSSKSFGYDEVPMNLLRLCSSFISSPLNYICNRTLSTGIFPDRLKYASIKPIFKIGKKEDINNYRLPFLKKTKK
jgi:hypothetical protein